MGLSPFPAEPESTSFIDAFEYVLRNADVILHQHDVGVPWAELMNAGGDSRLPQLLVDEIFFRATNSRRSGLRVFVATTPLNGNRDGLAPEWGTSSPPPGLENASLGDPAVQEAYEDWCLFLAEAYLPDFFAVVIEANMYEDARNNDWLQLLDLYQRVHSAIKQRIGNIPVFLTLQLEYLRGDLTLDGQPQWEVLNEIAIGVNLDIAALSTYPSIAENSVLEIGPSYFTEAVERVQRATNAPVIICETGYPSETVQTSQFFFVSSEQDQRDYLDILIEAAETAPVDLITWFFPFDFPEILNALEPELSPAEVEYMQLFVPMGLNDSQRFPKLSGILWEETLYRPVSAPLRR